MIRIRKGVGTNQNFILLSFVREKGDSILNDGIVRTAMAEEQLRPVSKNEFGIFYRDVLNGQKPKTPIAAFGNTVLGPSNSGSFPGIPYVNTNGEFKVEQNWTRGNTGDLLNDEWEFLFVPAE